MLGRLEENNDRLKQFEQEIWIQNKCYLASRELSENVIFEYDREEDSISFPRKIRSFLNGKII